MTGTAADASPLAGIRVLDLASYTPGPLCTSVLADLGAEVLKVERPDGGDPGRTVTPGSYRVLNRGKDLVALDLKEAEGRATLGRLVDDVDVLVQAFRPGAAERMGVGAAELTARNPRLVHCSITGFGSASAAPAHDIDVAARSGLLWMSGDADREPHRSGAVPHADVAAAHYAVAAILAALLRRERTGRGAVLEVPMAAAALKLVEFRLADHAADGEPSRARFLTRSAYGAFRASDGRRVALACVSDADWANLLTVLPPSPLRTDDRLRTVPGRAAHADVIRRELDDVFATRPAADWVALLEGVGVAAAPVLAPADLAGDPVISALGVYRPAADGELPVVAFPVSGLGVGVDAAR
jgi:crotonobetainyl-CoA:carnitine CoA-transferase CaiB-like acyl-CoA transferase